jgi:hypothetical protein
VRMALQGKATRQCALFPFVWMTPRFARESYEVLKDETTKYTDLAVLPAFGSQARKSVPTGTNPTKLVASKRAISWADIVKR